MASDCHHHEHHVHHGLKGPALGHAVSSLDPNEAPNVTARQEV